MSHSLDVVAAQFLVLALGVACSSAPAANGTASGGATSARGGSPGSGGTTTAPSGAGGATAGTGGIRGSGGALSSGGSTGGSAGTPGSGGRASDGGTPGSGGRDSDASAGSGGKAESGGATGRGGVTASGGATGLAGASGGRTGAGGARAGGASGSGGAPGTGGGSAGFAASYLLGADITNAEYASATAQDSLLSQLKSHGFNAIRLRTFVDPKAADGYDKTTGCADIAHTVAFGKKVKDLGMALVVDFHYSDNWADPGKQCVPIAWQGLATIDALATAVHDYTKDSITKLIAGGARPEMVQIGNETTPGMLIHVCDSDGLPTGNNKVTGAISNWANLGTLFKAGVKGVKDVDPKILIALHIDRCGDKPNDTQGAALNMSKTYIDNAIKQGVQFDVFGESCYQQYQGDPNNTTTTKAGWSKTLGGLATAYPSLRLMAAEYGPMQREINDVVFGLANQQGIGTFNWEPESSGDWNRGHELFTWESNGFSPKPDLTLYDQMKIDYASRL